MEELGRLQSMGSHSWTRQKRLSMHAGDYELVMDFGIKVRDYYTKHGMYDTDS